MSARPSTRWRYIVLAVLALIAAGLAWLYARPRFSLDPAQLRGVLAGQIDASFGAQLAALQNRDAPAAEIENLHRLRAEQYKRLAETAATVQQAAAQGGPAKVAAWALQQRDVDAALAIVRHALADADPAENRRSLAEAALLQAELLGAKLDPGGAQRALAEAAQFDQRWWKPHNRLGLMAWQAGQKELAGREWAEAARYVERDADRAVVLNNLGQALAAENRMAEAEALLRQALALNERLYGATHPNVASTLANLAQLLQDTGRPADAEPLLRRALAITEQNYGAAHAETALALNNLAAWLHAAGRFAEAEPLLRRTLAIDEKLLGAAHPQVAGDLNNLAQLLQQTGRAAEAEAPMRRALAIVEATRGAAHAETAIALNNLAQLLQDAHQPAEAEPLMRRVVAWFEQHAGPEDPNLAIALNNLARLLQASGRAAEAEPLMRRHVLIFLKTSRAAGQIQPHLREALANYRELLSALRLPPRQIRQRLDTLGTEAGFDAASWQRLRTQLDLSGPT